jgi:putative glutamine amidotransferase
VGDSVGEPVIGITAGIEKARWRAWHDLAFLSPRNYTLAVQRAGAMAILLPPDDAFAESPDALLGLLSGLIVSGGSDLHPSTYGASPHERTAPGRPERDRFEIALVRAALERDLPLLGICRGMEVMNVALGGTLIQHLPDAIGSERHSHTPGAFSDHEVRLEPGSLAAEAAGSERLAIKSHHHQALDRIGDGLRPTGWSLPDDVVEAVEVPDRAFALGVLWHPEEQVSDAIVGSFVNVAARAEAVTR